MSGEASRPLQRPSAATVNRNQKATTNRTNYTNEKEGTADDAKPSVFIFVLLTFSFFARRKDFLPTAGLVPAEA